MFPVYDALMRYLEDALEHPFVFATGSDDYAEMSEGIDAAFICGLAYVELERQGMAYSPLVAPVLKGDRYGQRPIYFSDVIVRHDSPYQCFEDLRGCSWAFNEPLSQSGYGVTRHHLAKMGECNRFFSRVEQSGYHERSLEWVCSGRIDASAIDSHLLEVALRDRPELKDDLRIIDTLGPSTIQPFIVANRIPEGFRERIRQALLSAPQQPELRALFDAHLVDNLVSVERSCYDDLRRMVTTCARVGMLSLG